MTQMTLTPQERELFERIASAPRYPIARLELHSSRERELVSIALEPVRVEDPGDSMEQVKERGALLKSLFEKGLIFLNYNLGLTVARDYAPYYESHVFALLEEMVEEGKTRPGFLFDRAVLRRGKAGLTVAGKAFWKELQGEEQ